MQRLSIFVPPFLAAIQEAVSEGGWDLHDTGQLGWPVRLYVFFLFGAILAAVIVTAKVCSRVGFFPPRDFRFLDEMVEDFRKRDLSSLSDHVKKLARTSPEAGLASFSHSLAPTGATGIISALRTADARFRHAVQLLEKEANSLVTMLGLTALLTLAYGVVGIINTSRVVLVQKAPTITSVAGGVNEDFELILWGILVWTFVYALRRHLRKRIEERRIAWEYFFNRVMALEYMIGAERQAGEASNKA